MFVCFVVCSLPTVTVVVVDALWALNFTLFNGFSAGALVSGDRRSLVCFVRVVPSLVAGHCV